MKNKREVKIRKRKDGLFEIRYSINGRQYSVYGATAALCRDKYGQILEEKKSQKRVKSILFITWYDKYINTYKNGTIKENTLRNQNGIFHNHILPYIGKKSLKQLTSEDIQIVVNKMSKFPRQQTIAFNYLNACLEQAKKLTLISHNPCDAVMIKKNTGNKGRALTKQEEVKLIDYLERENPKIKPLIYAYLTTGMRRSELLNIEFKDLDFDKNEISVKGTKTKNSKRIIQVNSQVLKLFPKISKPFGNWNKAIVNRQFRNICDTLGLKDITLHSLRHTFSTRCIEKGVPKEIVSKWLGHGSIALTLDTYTHVSEDYKRSVVDKLEYKYLP